MEKNNKKVSGKPEMPEDAVLVRQMGPLEFYFSKSEHILLAGISGQGGLVRLARPEIIGLLDVFDRQTQEKEETLLAELGCDDDDF